jgi:cytochrome P450
MRLPGVADVVAFAHPRLVGRVLVADVDAFGKTEEFGRAFGDGPLSVEGDRWRRRRETLGPPSFRDRVAGHADAVVGCVDRRVATWTPGESLDAETEPRDLTPEILFATLFGRELAPGEGTPSLDPRVTLRTAEGIPLRARRR